MRFKIDENLPVELAGELRTAGHEAATVRDQGLAGSTDPNLSKICKFESRIF